MLLIAASLLFTNPLPLDMPKAEAYLVRERDVYRLEDRFNKFDLWTSRSVDGRWADDDGRVFVLAHLDVLPPEGEAARSTATRQDYVAGRVKIDRRDLKAVRTAAAALSPIELAEKETRPHQQPRGFKDVDYWQGTNRSVIVCTYLPEKEKIWRLATWQLAEGDDYDECLKTFEKELFEDEKKEERTEERTKDKKRETRGERELLRADARHSVAAYENWHVTDAEEFSVLDALPASRDFIVTLTNDMAVMRRQYAETLPTHIDGSNVLCVARIYANRDDYLDALAASGLTNMMWSAAYWSPERRELVAYNAAPKAYSATPKGDATFLSRESEGSSTLLSTIRHEAFHQYLSYATAMIPTSPWLNEGYAEYFENGRLKMENGKRELESGDWWEMLGEKPTPEDLERYSAMLPAILLMDYDEFYSGSDALRRLKYALAQSIATFIEKGAPLVRFKPFENLKKDYFSALFETKDMRRATAAAFKDKERTEKFVAEWLKYWKER